MISNHYNGTSCWMTLQSSSFCAKPPLLCGHISHKFYMFIWTVWWNTCLSFHLTSFEILTWPSLLLPQFYPCSWVFCNQHSISDASLWWWACYHSQILNLFPRSVRKASYPSGRLPMTCNMKSSLVMHDINPIWSIWLWMSSCSVIQASGSNDALLSLEFSNFFLRANNNDTNLGAYFSITCIHAKWQLPLGYSLVLQFLISWNAIFLVLFFWSTNRIRSLNATSIR